MPCPHFLITKNLIKLTIGMQQEQQPPIGIGMIGGRMGIGGGNSGIIGQHCFNRGFSVNL
jgi:hypothetical protein